MSNPDALQTAQQRFDAMYITSAEVCAELRIGRTSVLSAKKRRLLPDPIVINGGLVCLWERDKVRPFIDAWKIVLQARRGADAV